MANEDWGGALRDLARGLINIETNTVLSSGITGRKMPAYPHALQDIIGKFANFLADEVGIDVDKFCQEFDERVRQGASEPDRPGLGKRRERPGGPRDRAGLHGRELLHAAAQRSLVVLSAALAGRQRAQPDGAPDSGAAARP